MSEMSKSYLQSKTSKPQNIIKVSLANKSEMCSSEKIQISNQFSLFSAFLFYPLTLTGDKMKCILNLFLEFRYGQPPAWLWRDISSPYLVVFAGHVFT